MKPDINDDVKPAEEIPPTSEAEAEAEALSAAVELPSFPTVTLPAVPAEPVIDEKLEIDDLMAGKRMISMYMYINE